MAERPLLGEVLLQAGVIDELQLSRALGEQHRWSGRLGLALLRLGFVGEAELLRALSRQLGVPAVRLGNKRVSAEALELVPAELAEKYRCLPLFLKRDGGREVLHVAMEDPTDLAAIDDLAFRTGRRVRPVLMGPDELRRAMARFYGGAAGDSGDPGESAVFEETPLRSGDTAPDVTGSGPPDPGASGRQAPGPESDSGTRSASASAAPAAAAAPDASGSAGSAPGASLSEADRSARELSAGLSGADPESSLAPGFEPEEILAAAPELVAQGERNAATMSGLAVDLDESQAPGIATDVAPPPEEPEASHLEAEADLAAGELDVSVDLDDEEDPLGVSGGEPASEAPARSPVGEPDASGPAEAASAPAPPAAEAPSMGPAPAPEETVVSDAAPAAAGQPDPLEQVASLADRGLDASGPIPPPDPGAGAVLLPLEDEEELAPAASAASLAPETPPASLAEPTVALDEQAVAELAGALPPRAGGPAAAAGAEPVPGRDPSGITGGTSVRGDGMAEATDRDPVLGDGLADDTDADPVLGDDGPVRGADALDDPGAALAEAGGEGAVQEAAPAAPGGETSPREAAAADARDGEPCRPGEDDPVLGGAAEQDADARGLAHAVARDVPVSDTPAMDPEVEVGLEGRAAELPEAGSDASSGADAERAAGDSHPAAGAGDAAASTADAGEAEPTSPAASAGEAEAPAAAAPASGSPRAAGPAPFSTRDVLRALTEILIEKEILEPGELVARVRAVREGSDPAA